MDNNREFVESVWDDVADMAIEKSYHVYFDDHASPKASGETEAEAWQAAADFTRARLAEIKDVEEEIAALGNLHAADEKYEPLFAAFKRTLTRLQGILAEKKRGMK